MTNSKNKSSEGAGRNEVTTRGGGGGGYSQKPGFSNLASGTLSLYERVYMYMYVHTSMLYVYVDMCVYMCMSICICIYILYVYVICICMLYVMCVVSCGGPRKGVSK